MSREHQALPEDAISPESATERVEALPSEVEQGISTELPKDTPSPEDEKQEKRAQVQEARKELLLTEIDSHPFHFILESIPDTVRAEVSPEQTMKILDRMAAECAGAPELLERYKKIFIEGDFDALREQSHAMLEVLRDEFFRDTQTGFRTWFRPKKRRQRKEREAHLEQFRAMMNAGRVVRSDSGDHTTYLSPRKTGHTASFGPNDILVQADRYVYASLDVFPHHMAQGTDTSFVQEEGLGERAEIVMMDVADLLTRAGDTLIDHYLNNLFSYEEGKEILACYLADIFRSPAEARAWIKKNTKRRDWSQRWDSEQQDFEVLVDWKTREELDAATEQMRQRDKEIRQRMRELLEKFDLEPPLGMEVRIPDTAERIVK